jgi:hypothetical protein
MGILAKTGIKYVPKNGAKHMKIRRKSYGKRN